MPGGNRSIKRKRLACVGGWLMGQRKKNLLGKKFNLLTVKSEAVRGWAFAANVPYTTVISRLARGCSDIEALTGECDV